MATYTSALTPQEALTFHGLKHNDNYNTTALLSPPFRVGSGASALASSGLPSHLADYVSLPTEYPQNSDTTPPDLREMQVTNAVASGYFLARQNREVIVANPLQAPPELVQPPGVAQGSHTKTLLPWPCRRAATTFANELSTTMESHPAEHRRLRGKHSNDGSLGQLLSNFSPRALRLNWTYSPFTLLSILTTLGRLAITCSMMPGSGGDHGHQGGNDSNYRVPPSWDPANET